jgi:predicted esterase
MRRLALVLMILTALATRGDELKRGEIVDGIVSSIDSRITYAYYLPRAYTADRTWPVLYVFDPRQRGAFAAGLFRAAAEEYGWILISSNNTRSDTNTDMNVPALEGTLPDARRRFAIDPARQYAAGFSGTAILAWALALATNEIAGVIGCSGRPLSADAQYRVPFAWFGAAGSRDFNYLETLEIERGMAAAKQAHHVEIFDGQHRWAPPEVLRRAIEWMEIEAMKRGLRPRDEAFIRRAFDSHVELAQTDADPMSAARRLSSMVRTFEGLVDVSAARQREARLRAAPAFIRAQKDSAQAETLERTHLRRVYPVINRFVQSDEVPMAPALAQALGVPRLQKIAAAGSYRGDAAQRVLATIYVQLDFYAAAKVSGPKLVVAKSVASMIHPR